MTRLMRSFLVLGVVLLLQGCASSGRPSGAGVLLLYPHALMSTPTESGYDHYQRVSAVAHRDAQALSDDLDLLFLTDRPTRLTRWHAR